MRESDRGQAQPKLRASESEQESAVHMAYSLGGITHLQDWLHADDCPSLPEGVAVMRKPNSTHEKNLKYASVWKCKVNTIR